MRKAVIFMMAIAVCGIAVAQENEWEAVGAGIRERGVRAVAVDAVDERVVYAGTERAVYRSEDVGKTWREILVLKGTRKAVNDIAVDAKNNNAVYVSTEDGLFFTADLGKTWKKIFDGSGDFERNIRRAAIDPEDNSSIYIATRGGVFSSNDCGATWRKATTLRNTPINYIAVRHMSPSVLFAGASSGAFLSRDDGATWQRIFVSQQVEEDYGERDTSDDAEPEADETLVGVEAVNAIVFDPIDERKVYLGASSGAYVSADDGASWRRLSNAGLKDERIDDILITKDNRVCAATPKGVFVYYPLDERWDELYKGKSNAASQAIAYSEKGNSLWGAFDAGLFKARLASLTMRSKTEEAKRKLFARLNNEPTIQDVQKFAMRYADCDPNKITLWRVGAQARAFMPKVKFGLDHDKSSNIDVDRGGTADPDRFVDGPWDSSRGWDASVEWDLGNIIWNPAQTSIDVRSRLTAQLRDDVLSDVTRSYFERKRLIIELAQYPPADLKLRQEKELRVEELAANIDGLTGGYFSKEVARRQK